MVTVVERGLGINANDESIVDMVPSAAVAETPTIAVAVLVGATFGVGVEATVRTGTVFAGTARAG